MQNIHAMLDPDQTPGRPTSVDSESRASEIAAIPQEIGHGIHVLLADDDDVLRGVQTDFLRRFGFTVHAAEDGRAAINSLKNNHVDLVITDMVMPGSDGVEVIRHIRKLFPDMKIIAISGGGATRRELLLDIARVLGVSRTVEKPFTMTTLLGTVLEVLGLRS